jgi:hypothetical protein
MDRKITILQPKDVEAIQLLADRQNYNHLTLKYRDKNYERLNLFFNNSMQERALEFCHKCIAERQKQCLLIQEECGFSVWSEIILTETLSQEQLITNEVPIELTANETSCYVTQASLLILQIIADEIEYLMGAKQKKTFVKELISFLQKSGLPATDSLEKIEALLGLDPMKNNGLPIWKQPDLDTFFTQITFLGVKYFGNTSFINRTVDYLKQLPLYREPEFMHCVQQFLSLAQK